MKQNEFSLTLVPSGDEPSILSHDTQAELRSFLDALHQHGIEATPNAIVRKSAGAEWSFFGDFFIPIAQIIGPTLGVVIVAWLQGRAGRKVRIKTPDIEAEARTPEEIKELLQHIQEFKVSVESKDESKP
jgi:hypothetical protein